MIIQLLLIQVFTFVGLIFVLRFLFYRQLSSALGRLKHLHEENLQREEELKKELEIARQEKETELAKAKEEAAQIIKEAKGKAEAASGLAQQQAKQEVEKIIERAKLDSKKFENEIIAKSQEQAIDLSVSMLKFTFGQQEKQALQHELIVELIEEIERLPAEKFTVKAKQAKVTSAFTLNKEEKEKLAQVLSLKAGVAVELEELNDPEVIMGLVIEMGGFTIDGSLRNKLKKVIPYLKETKNSQLTN